MASCLGIGGSTRRGAARTAAAKARMTTSNSDRSSPVPFAGGSENGDSDNESLSGKKGKSESSNTSYIWTSRADIAEPIMNSNGKKKASPSKNILKKTKSYPASCRSSNFPQGGS
jgi:hypothetical protein